MNTSHFFSYRVHRELNGHKNSLTIRLFREHRLDELQFEHYADDLDEEDNANGWRHY